MRTTSLKTVYLTEDELKQAIVEYLEKEHEELAQHLYDNECEMVWGQDGEEFIVGIDGEMIDKDYSVDIQKAAEARVKHLKKWKNTKWYNCAHCDAGYPDQECTCGRTRNENKHARQKEIDKMVGQVTSAATKAVHEVAEQHKEAFEKLAENKEEND